MIIRFNPDEVFSTDSSQYEILENAVKNIGNDGLIVEIGSRAGGSARIIADSLVEYGHAEGRTMLCIDPYGNIEYPQTNMAVHIHYPHVKLQGDVESKDIIVPTRIGYTNQMRNDIIPSLYYYMYNLGLNFAFLCLEDTEYFKRYSDGYPVYEEHKRMETNYSFVFFDGPHTTEAVEEEVKFFLDRITPGSVFVFDDCWMYDHDKIEQLMFDKGMVTIDKGIIKCSYKYIEKAPE